MKKTWKVHVVAVLFLVACLYGAFKVLLLPGFFTMHDDTQVGRVVVMGRALRNGQFPVRWVSDLGYGYGYPLYNFYGPLPYYVGGVFYALGVDGLLATKIIFFIAIVGAAISMYALSSKLFGVIGGLTSSLLYSYAPYHAVDIYIRGALGEAWVLIFLPLVVLGFWYMYGLHKEKLGMLLSGLSLAGIVLSHTILGYVTMVLVVLFTVGFWIVELLTKQPSGKFIRSMVLSIFIGLGISAFFWLPALFEMNSTNVLSQIGTTSQYKDHFVCLSQLWDSPWGFGGSTSGCTDGISFRIGKLHILLGLVSLFGFILFRKQNPKHSVAVYSACILIGISIVFMLPISLGLWNLLPKFAYVQYPWRFLTFVLFGLSFLAGGIGLFIKNRWISCVYLVVVVLITLSVYQKLFVPQYVYQKSPSEFETDSELKWGVSKISDEYLPPQVARPNTLNDVPGKLVTGSEDFSIDTLINTEVYSKLWITSRQDNILTIHKAYFPGWKYIYDGREVAPVIQKGLPVIPFMSGSHTVELRFTNTPVRWTSNILSIGLAFLLLYLYGKKSNT